MDGKATSEPLSELYGLVTAVCGHLNVEEIGTHIGVYVGMHYTLMRYTFMHHTLCTLI